MQTEYSLFTRDVEDDGVLATVRELGIGFVPYSPLGRGFLSGKIRSLDDFDETTSGAPRRVSRARTSPRTSSCWTRSSPSPEAKAVTPSQLALAWVLAQGADMVPIPGTRRIANLEENVAAIDVQLTADDLAAIERVAPAGVAAGERYAPAGMKALNH